MFFGEPHTSKVIERLFGWSKPKRILVVGPNTPFKDPSSLFLSNYLHPHDDARLTLLDVQGMPGEAPGSLGGLYDAVLQFRRIDRMGVPLVLPTSIAADVLRARMAPHDVVFDHYALPFIAATHTRKNPDRRQTAPVIEAALEAYLRALTPGGRLILATDGNYLPAIRNFLQARNLRFKVRPIDDKYHLRVSMEVANRLRDALPMELIHEIRRTRGGLYKVILKPEYVCSHLVIATKPMDMP